MEMGLLQFGHNVTTVAAENVEIEICSTVTLQEGFENTVVKTAIENVIKEYFLELKKEWETADSLMIRIAHIESKILNVDGVLDISDTKIKNGTSNVALTNEQIPHLSEVILNA